MGIILLLLLIPIAFSIAGVIVVRKRGPWPKAIGIILLICTVLFTAALFTIIGLSFLLKGLGSFGPGSILTNRDLGNGYWLTGNFMAEPPEITVDSVDVVREWTTWTEEAQKIPPVISQIAWNDDYVLAETTAQPQESSLYTEQYWILLKDTGIVIGPLTEESFEQEKKKYRGLHDLVLQDVHSYFNLP